MKPTLLVSSKVVAEFGPRISVILASAPRPIDLLPFTPALQLTPEQTAHIEAAYYSRDIWEGTEKSALSPAAQAFWAIIDRAQNLKWMAVYSAGMDQKRYVDAMQRGIRLTSSAGAQAEAVGLACVTGVLAPSKTSPLIINRLNQEVVRFLKSPDIKERFLNAGEELVGSSTEQFAAKIASDMTKTSKLIKDLGIKVN